MRKLCGYCTNLTKSGGGNHSYICTMHKTLGSLLRLVDFDVLNIWIILGIVMSLYGTAMPFFRSVRW
jgi:hypothetical protein